MSTRSGAAYFYVVGNYNTAVWAPFAKRKLRISNVQTANAKRPANTFAFAASLLASVYQGANIWLAAHLFRG